MNDKIIPRKHRKYVISMINDYKHNVGKRFINWDSFLTYRLNGTNEGWLKTNNKEYQALLWLIGIKDMMSYLDGLESESK